jgi:hypothetical protein
VGDLLEPRYADLMVFTACRVWHHAVESVHSSKLDAARWALARDSGLDGVEAALSRRAGGSVPLSEAHVRRVLDRVLGAVGE